MSGTPATCDGSAHDGGPCRNPLAVECECALCSHEEQNYRYHSCLAHRMEASAAHKSEHGATPTLWKVYEMPRATEASPPPAEELSGPCCDGSPDGKRCQYPLIWQCTCRRCARERDASEKFHACEAHKGAATDRHRQIRERQADWAAYLPVQAEDEVRLIASKVTVVSTGPIIGEDFHKAMRDLETAVYGSGTLLPSGREIVAECQALTCLLLQKNAKYGDSALNPRRVFAKADAVEQIKVRIDDKINRIEKGDASIEDEDVIQDLLGYLILLRIATKRKAAASAKKDP